MTAMHNHYDVESRKAIIDDIEKFGCQLISIDSTNYMPAFAYSIGLYQKYGRPEIICFGLKTEVMAGIINHARDLIQSGETIIPNKTYQGFLEGYQIQFIEVNKAFYPNYLGYAGWFYDMSFDFLAMQIVWPDKQHRFPWDNDFNPDWKYRQPLLDRNTDFKFYEEKNLAVYTTKQTFEGEPILYVYHENDGSWQFHTSLNPDFADIKIVGLQEIVKLDPSINEIYHLEYGCNAWRSSSYDNWQYTEQRNAPATEGTRNNESINSTETSTTERIPNEFENDLKITKEKKKQWWNLW